MSVSYSHQNSDLSAEPIVSAVRCDSVQSDYNLPEEADHALWEIFANVLEWAVNSNADEKPTEGLVWGDHPFYEENLLEQDEFVDASEVTKAAHELTDACVT